MIDFAQRRAATAATADNVSNNEIADAYASVWGANRAISQINIELIRPYRTPQGKPQPYKIRTSKVKALMSSMEDLGILQPLIVQKIDTDDGKEYQILCGHHRYFAASKLNFATLPCEVKVGLDELDAYKIVAESNPPKDDEGEYPSELAEIFTAYMNMRKDSEENTAQLIANKFNVSRKSIYRYINLLKCPAPLVDAVDYKKFPFSVVDDALAIFNYSELKTIGQYISFYDAKISTKKYTKLKELLESDKPFTVDNIAEKLSEAEDSVPAEDDTSSPEVKDSFLTTVRAVYRETEVSSLNDGDLKELLLRLVGSYLRNSN